MKRLSTLQLCPGMILGKDIYSHDDQLILPSGFCLTDRAITKLELYGVPFVFIKEFDNDDTVPEDNVEELAEQPYSIRLRQSEEFKQFSENFQQDVDIIKNALNDVVEKNAPLDVDTLLHETLSLLDGHQSSFHIFDMLHNMRNFDDITYTHGLNVGLICNVLATWLKFSPEDVELATQCGLLHDLGKLKIPEKILKKPEKLTDFEYEIIKTHPVESHKILKKCNVNPHILNAALMHHERCDGSGYPYHLKGDKIDKFAKIVAIADAYDAMTSARVYRGPMCPFKVVEIFEREGFQKYETAYIMTFLENIINTYLSHKVRLSDGRVGTVIFVNSHALSRPLIKCGNDYVDLSKESSSLTVEAIL